MMLEIKIFLNGVLIQSTTSVKKHMTIGRSADCDVVLDNKHVSRLEAIIQYRDGRIHLQDKSTNGIFVEGEKVIGDIELPVPCRFKIFPFEIEYGSLSDDVTVPIPTGSFQEATTSYRVSEPMLSSETAGPLHYAGLVGDGTAMQEVYRLIQEVGNSPATVLIRGEHGTGKELVAQALHDVSPCRKGPFVPVNCAAIPFELFESELFGYEKGAFTGAQAAKQGKIEDAEGGTLFLDEVGELSLPAQAKFLRFLQEKKIIRLGSSREIPIKVRVVAATNRDLERAVSKEEFRADLYYRLRVVEIPLPPLRDRLEDIPGLVAHLQGKLAKEIGLQDKVEISEEAIRKLQKGQWPGNIRQLENVLYTASLRARAKGVIDGDAIMADARSWMESPIENGTPLDTISKNLLLDVLVQQQWDTSKAAAVLKVSRGTIYYKMKKYGIEASRSLGRHQKM
ncbi:MAG: sigma 54-interacting transcriptional regulator [Nitrospirota bacterium]|nr:sigma 54-interacting transcriptional regulator [Nitrospirota bacterium]